MISDQQSNNISNQNLLTQTENFVPQPIQYNQNQYAQKMQNQQTQGILDKVNATKDSVIEFIKSKNPLKGEEPIEKICLGLAKIDYDSFSKIIKENLKEVQSQTITKNDMNDTTIISKIVNPRNIDGGYFQKSYTLYDISTEQKNWLVNRRYSDFLWLRECLMNQFPGEPIPMLPGKKLGNRRLEQDFIIKRQKRLQKFLDEILSKEKFKSSDVLNVFLSCSDRTFFEHQMKLMAPKIFACKYVENIKTFEGKIKIYEFEGENDLRTTAFFNNLNKYFSIHSDFLNKIHGYLKEFHLNMAAACSNLAEIEKYFGSLNKINDASGISENISNVYENYEIFFKNWKRVLINQTCVIKDNVNLFFKDINNKNISLGELLAQQEIIKDDYQSKKSALNNKKEKLYSQSDISKWEINPMDPPDMSKIFRDKAYAFQKMCFVETNELNRMRDLLGYYYNKSLEHFIGLIKENEKSYTNNISDFSSLLEPSLSDIVNVWSNLTTSINKN